MHCWVILRNIPRWMEGPQEEARRVAPKHRRLPTVPIQADREEVPMRGARENMARAGVTIGFTSSESKAQSLSPMRNTFEGWQTQK